MTHGANVNLCTGCGAQLPSAESTHCVACGARAESAAGAPASADGAVKYLIPIGRSGLAIAAGYAGLFCLLILPGPIAMVLGVLAIMDLRKHPNKLGRGRAWFGLIAGVIASALLAFGAIVSLMR